MSPSARQYITDNLVGGGNTGEDFANGGEWADFIAQIAKDARWFESEEDAGDGWGCYTESTDREEYVISRSVMVQYWNDEWGTPTE